MFFDYRELAHKILVTGKSINFLKDICDERTLIKGRKELKEYLESNGKTNMKFLLMNDFNILSIFFEIVYFQSKTFLPMLQTQNCIS